jgi:hypothetical protein
MGNLQDRRQAVETRTLEPFMNRSIGCFKVGGGKFELLE